MLVSAVVAFFAARKWGRTKRARQAIYSAVGFIGLVIAVIVRSTDCDTSADAGIGKRYRMSHFLSSEFFHLVGAPDPLDDAGNFETLKTILEDGCIKHADAIHGDRTPKVRVDLSKRLESNERFQATITCYCDIPFDYLDFHAKKYGRFGLSFHRDFIIHSGARPVIYVPTRSDDTSSPHGKSLLGEFDAAYGAFRKYLHPFEDGASKQRTFGREPNHAEGALHVLDSLLSWHLLPYVKAYNSELPEDDLNYFYSEREWRLANCLWFVPADVTRVVVAQTYAERAKEALPAYANKIYSL